MITRKWCSLLFASTLPLLAISGISLVPVLAGDEGQPVEPTIPLTGFSSDVLEPSALDIDQWTVGNVQWWIKHSPTFKRLKAADRNTIATAFQTRSIAGPHLERLYSMDDMGAAFKLLKSEFGVESVKLRRIILDHWGPVPADDDNGAAPSPPPTHSEL